MDDGLYWAQLQLDGNDFGRCFTSCGKTDERVFCTAPSLENGSETRTVIPTCWTTGILQIPSTSGGRRSMTDEYGAAQPI